MPVVMNLYIWNKVVPLSGRAGMCVAVAQTEPHAMAVIERDVGVNPGTPNKIVVFDAADMPVGLFVRGPKKKKKKKKQANT
jgi:hypothetical protein